MSFIRNLARKYLGKSFEINDLVIAFHKEANLYGTHGHLRATHIDQNIKDAPVRFVFIGMTRPPELTPTILTYIWEEARAKGYVPHGIHSYGHAIDLKSAKMDDIISPERRSAEDASYLTSVLDKTTSYNSAGSIVPELREIVRSNEAPTVESIAEFNDRIASRVGADFVHLKNNDPVLSRVKSAKTILHTDKTFDASAR